MLRVESLRRSGLGPISLAVFGAIRLLTDDRDRLRLDRLHTG